MRRKNKIVFRADASPEIGYGHFIRTLALADMLKNDFDCLFVTQSPSRYQLEEAASVCPLKTLPADETKFSLFLDMLNGDEIVVLDNYFFGTDYQYAIKAKGCRLVCIDDMHDKHYVADVVINHSPGLGENKFSVEPYTQIFLGLDYALLRKEFLEYKYDPRKIRKSVMVCFGGVDHFDITGKIVRAIDEDIPLEVIIGDSYCNTAELYKYRESHSNINLHRNISAKEMVDIMAICRLAIVPASSIFFESLFTGLNCIYGYYVDNQKEICDNIGTDYSLGIECVGNWRNVDISSLREMAFRDSPTNGFLAMHKQDIRKNYKNIFNNLVLE